MPLVGVAARRYFDLFSMRRGDGARDETEKGWRDCSVATNWSEVANRNGTVLLLGAGNACNREATRQGRRTDAAHGGSREPVGAAPAAEAVQRQRRLLRSRRQASAGTSTNILREQVRQFGSPETRVSSAHEVNQCEV